MEGEQELERRTSALAARGGAFDGFLVGAEALLRAALPDTTWRPLVAKLRYSVGFVIVVLGRQRLFTDNTLSVVLPALRRRDSLMLASVTRLWATVLTAHLVGAAAFAWVVARTSIFAPDVRAVLTRWSAARSYPKLTWRTIRQPVSPLGRTLATAD